jgi:preprotein translocase subunit SecE
LGVRVPLALPLESLATARRWQEAAVKLWARIRGFVDDVVKELKRTSWPSRTEVQGTTLVVVVAVLIVAVYLGAVDAVLGWLYLVVFGGKLFSS